jgi:hypothetical protein
MRRTFLAVLLVAGFVACKNPEADISGDEKITADDFVKAFHSLDLPLIIADTSLKNFGDSITISKPVFTQFFPRFCFTKIFG